MPYILVANKADYEDRFNKKVLEEARSELNVKAYFETSAKERKGVVEAFSALAKLALQHYIDTPIPPEPKPVIVEESNTENTEVANAKDENVENVAVNAEDNAEISDDALAALLQNLG